MLPPHNWVPSYNLALTPRNRLYAPGAGGKLLIKDDADAAGGTLRHDRLLRRRRVHRHAGRLRRQRLHQHADHGRCRRATSSSASSSPARNPAGLVSGIARVGADGTGSWVVGRGRRRRRRDRQGGDEQRAGAVDRREHAVRRGQQRAGRRLGARRLSARARQHDARDARARRCCSTRAPARVRASATTRPRRRRSAPTATSSSACSRARSARTTRAAGCSTSTPRWRRARCRAASAGTTRRRSCPASMVPSYAGGSPYLLMTKYNNYAGVGSGDGAEPARDPRPAREPERPDLGPAGDEGGADDPRADARAGQRDRGQGVVHQHRRGRPGDASRSWSTARTAISTAGTSSATR